MFCILQALLSATSSLNSTQQQALAAAPNTLSSIIAVRRQLSSCFAASPAGIHTHVLPPPLATSGVAPTHLDLGGMKTIVE